MSLHRGIRPRLFIKTPETFSTLKMILKIKKLVCNLDVDIFVGITV
jgi:hypothetical protein